jgi:serine/threonine-protein kinase
VTLALAGDRAGADRALARAQPEHRTSVMAVRGRVALWYGDPSLMLEAAPYMSARPGGASNVFATIWNALAVGAKPSDDLEATILASGMRPRQRTWFLQLAIEAYAVGGATARALEALEHASELPLVDVLWMDRCPLLAALRPDRRFAHARSRVAARAAALW